jgi:spore coat protein U-like protein
VRHLARIVLACALLAGATQAHAVCVGSIVVTTTPVQFMNYDPVSFTPKTATGNINVKCSVVSLLQSYTVSLSAGPGNGYGNRQLVNGSHRLDYNLYTSNTYQYIWGDGTGGTQRVRFDAFLQLLSSVDHTVYGLIPARQDRPAGAYAATISVTVDF